MPTYEGVDVWIEDSEHRKLNHQEVTINLVDSDDRTVTVKIEMLRDELYTVHCLSPISVLCDVFVTGSSGVRKSAARFYLDKSLAVSKNVSGSSTDHTVQQFREHGLRTQKRAFKQGKLGTVEVEIRRIGEIIKGEPREEYETDEDARVFIMIDEPHEPPWLIFRFDIRKKDLPAVPASTAGHNTRGRASRRMFTNQSQATGSRNETPREMGDECLPNPKKRPREYDVHDESSGVGENPIYTNSDLLQQEYQKEEAEEQRLLQKLQERLQSKKTRNVELRRLLGETE
ncbi:hypothetical protein OG21DRAFT_1505110 [Imleria badia]|nr:hypothetical protein OG21DRAFT_1505110 [Imleria badia]